MASSKRAQFHHLLLLILSSWTQLGCHQPAQVDIPECSDLLTAPSSDLLNCTVEQRNASFEIFQVNWLSGFQQPEGMLKDCQCSLAIMSTLGANISSEANDVCVKEEDRGIACMPKCLTQNNSCLSKQCPDANDAVDMCIMYQNNMTLDGTTNNLQIIMPYLDCDSVSKYLKSNCVNFVLHSASSTPTKAEEDSSDIESEATMSVANSLANQSETIGLSVGLGLVLLIVVVVVVSLFYVVHSKKLLKKNVPSQRLNVGNLISLEESRSGMDLSSQLPSNYTEPETTLLSTKMMYGKKLEEYREIFKDLLVEADQIYLGENIGEGAFGRVQKGLLLRNDGQVDVALKSPKVQSSDEDLMEFMSESVIMMAFDHPNVLKLFGVCLNTADDLPIIILPYMANGDLKSFLVSSRTTVDNTELPEGLEIDVLMGMCLDIARGMEYLSERKFVHRDLAARNCMIDMQLSIKIGDFGFSRDIYNIDYYRLERKTRLPVKWLPPESLFDNKYNEKTDVWAFGVTCWEVFSLGRTPYVGLDNADIADYINNGNRLGKPSLCSKEMYDLMQKCWSASENDRPMFSALVTLLSSLRISQRHDSQEEHGDEKNFYFVLENTSN